MRAARAVTVIPAIAGRFTSTSIGNTTLKRVAAYARVSTDNDEQLSSYGAQKDYYTRHIQSNPIWEFVDVYADEGISATSTKKRDGFNRMIADAMNGKIDLIITKSVSRFARNTVDTLTTVRQLKEKGVEVYFEKENIYTLDSKGELLITIMSSLAQEESRSISENVTWGQRKRFADGKVSLPYRQFLGYEKGGDGLPKIVEKEAEVVRLIYKMFLEGKTPTGIAKYLTANNIPTPAKKTKWPPSTVLNILQNEKYKGDAILQKTFTVDFLTKKKKHNEGEVPQYYVENSHPAIIAPEIFELVQHELKKRKAVKGYKTGGEYFSGTIICGECGSFYGSKVWHSNSKYRRIIWQCNHKYSNDEKCETPHIYEDMLKQAFLEAFNSLINNKDEIIQNYNVIIQSLTNTTKLDRESTRLQRECEIVTELIRKCIEENAHNAVNQEVYQERYVALKERFESINRELINVDDKRLELKAKCESTISFIQTFEKCDELLTEFDPDIWNALIEKVTIHSKHDVTFTFKNSMDLEWKI